MEKKWDVIVIGTGMGGATIGYYLSKHGKKVLFLEKGLSHDAHCTEQNNISKLKSAKDRFYNGYWPDKITYIKKASLTEIYPVAGCGSGGSTTLYASQLERFFKEDFEPRKNFPHVSDTTLPNKWPVTFDEMLPYYEAAEKLFRVRGTPDPLNSRIGSEYYPAPKISDNDHQVFETLKVAGLHPYRAHVACEFVLGCTECVGQICSKDCKNDARKICLNPAINNYGAEIINQCEVLKLEADGSNISGVVCSVNNKTVEFRADIVVLAAGGLHTPAILLKSKSDHWPNGLSNSSGLVGRNLMWHASDFIAVKSFNFKSSVGARKALAFNDFYFHNGTKMGTVQSVGVSVDFEYILSYAKRVKSKFPKLVQFILHDFICRTVAKIGGCVFKNTVLLVTIVEDLPYLHNRVFVDDLNNRKIVFEYSFTSELRARSSGLIKKVSEALRNYWVIRLSRRSESINFGHPCGTCRFGDDPKSSVLNQNNRSHDIDNLYVCDASFFPSSGGTNPSLTIAANAIRVAEKILGRGVK